MENLESSQVRPTRSHILMEFPGFWDTPNLKSNIIWNLKASNLILRVPCSPGYFALLFWIFVFWFYQHEVRLIQVICLDQGSANYSLQDVSCPLPGFINKISLAHSHAHHVMYSLWLLSHCNHRIVTETIWLAQPKIFTIWPFAEEVCWPLI